MIDSHLIPKTDPIVKPENTLLFLNYRISILKDGLFRIEKSDNKAFRDEATISFWFRNLERVDFETKSFDDHIEIKTSRCELHLFDDINKSYVLLDSKEVPLFNDGNLHGTYRTLDCCDGRKIVKTPWAHEQHKVLTDEIVLEDGVCSVSGVALIDDSMSPIIDSNGEAKAKFADGFDYYIFAYGHDYREAVKALYDVTGKAPLIPRFALGNWWSRYHMYTDFEYLRLLNDFKKENIPFTVATLDMDWHYSNDIDKRFRITEKGLNTDFYGGNNGWTGYSWNRDLFKNPKRFLKDIKDMGLRVTINVHPADGIRWFEDQYKDMAIANHIDPKTKERVKFDITNSDFINSYFKLIHKPFEKEGVDFFWLDWQQGFSTGLDNLDPLWSINNYHYLDNAKENMNPLILSRYCGIGSHRYPIGFSGDSFVTWDTLKWLPEFTSTATNAGYTWWSHDIGGHMYGYKDDELYIRSLQFGIFSPINRLHSTNIKVSTKEPWAFKNGTGAIAKDVLRFRHRMIPYLYTASYENYKNGFGLIEPLYYAYDTLEAYSHKNEYIFSKDMIVSNAYTKVEKDGFTHIKTWLPEGVWTDIFTGTKYHVKKSKTYDMARKLESIPVLIKEGSLLILSNDEGNSVNNPKELEARIYSGNGHYSLYEDLRNVNDESTLFTNFTFEKGNENGLTIETVRISLDGELKVMPKDRSIIIRFMDTYEGEVYVNGVLRKREYDKYLSVKVKPNKEEEIVIKAIYKENTELDDLKEYALNTLLEAECDNEAKTILQRDIEKVKSVKEYLNIIKNAKDIPNSIKKKLKETL